MDYNFDQIKHDELKQSYKSGANWFYWIAGLTIITSLITLGGGGIRFLFGLGITQLFDGIGHVLAEQVGSAAKVVALVLDLLVTGVFVGLGVLANKRLLWAYLLGMVLFLLDGVLSLVLTDWISLIAHAVVLFFLFRGFQAGRELESLEKNMAAQQAAAQPAI